MLMLLVLVVVVLLTMCVLWIEMSCSQAQVGGEWRSRGGLMVLALLLMSGQSVLGLIHRVVVVAVGGGDSVVVAVVCESHYTQQQKYDVGCGHGGVVKVDVLCGQCGGLCDEVCGLISIGVEEYI